MKKRSERLSTNISVEVRSPNGENQGNARVKNLTSDGLLVERSDAFPVASGEAIGIEIPANEARGRVMILGQVAWANEGQAGVRVNGMLPHHRARFERMVSTIATGQTLLG